LAFSASQTRVLNVFTERDVNLQLHSHSVCSWSLITGWRVTALFGVMANCSSVSLIE